MKAAEEFLKQEGVKEIKNIGTGFITNRYAVSPELIEAYAQDENKALQAEVDRKDKFIDDVRLFIKSPHSSKDSAYWHKLKQLNDDIDKI